MPSSPQAKPAAPGAEAAKAGAKTTGEIGPNTPVITIVGVCEKTAAGAKTAASGKASGDACKTVITKSEFESLADALQPPHMNPATKRRLADAYPKFVVMANAAHKRGLDATPNFKKILNFYKMQLLTQELARSVKEEAEKIPDSEIDTYYKNNTPEFEEAELKRLYIPKDKQVEAAAAEKPEPKSSDQQKADEDALKKEADTLRTRAAAGEDFDKLQKEAYDAAGLKGTPPQTGIGKLTRNELPVTHRSVLDLKAGEVSQVLAEPNGYYIYKVVSRDVKPLDEMKAEIRSKLAQQKFQEDMQAIESSATTKLNEAYFETSGTPGMPAGAMRPAPPQAAPPSPAQPTAPNPPAVNQNPSPENPKK
jgi:hypothetical protein